MDALDAYGLQLIRLDDGRVVLSRGVAKVVLSGDGIDTIAQTLLSLLDGTRARDEIVEAFPDALRREVDRLLTAMEDRGLVRVGERPSQDDDALQSSFYANFGARAADARTDLASASVVVFGINLITRSLARSLLELGVGSLKLVDHHVLSNSLATSRPEGLDGRSQDAGRLTVVDEAGVEPDLDRSSLICATSDLGEPEALAELNRLALRASKRFLPAWIADFIGYVGPLTHPYETACFRCYRLRADSNDPAYAVRRQVRREVTEDVVGRASSGLLPPMAGIVGEIAAMEVLKALTQLVPSDAVGRLIETNLVSFSATVRRVLKVPRCPDCGDVSRRSGVVLEDGPQIPFRG